MSPLTDSTVGKGKRAIVVDDESVVGEIMCKVLEQMGFTVDAALNGQQALDLTRSQAYDTAICDVLMPGINGMNLYETWCQECPSLAARTIFVTGDNLGFETSQFLTRTGCRCIYKPFKLADLAQAVVDIQSDPQ
jgi:CheY-like chemotaxis protein